MITIRLLGAWTATVDDGVWTVEDNAELTRVLNEPSMQPPVNGHYAPSENARKAEHVLRTMGGEWVSSDEHVPSGKLY